MHVKIFLHLCILFTEVILSAQYDSPNNPEVEIDYRLDGSVIPSKYRILLTPYILENEQAGKERFTFDGEAAITITATKDLNSIVLHAKSLTIKKEDIQLKTMSANPYEISNFQLDQTTDKLTINVKDKLLKDNEYLLCFKYVGKLGNDMIGFYKSYYKDVKGKQVWLGISKFETHYARRAFPCFDEPKYKATFDIEISRHKDLKSVSNAPIVSSNEESNGRVIDKFKRTPKMSTYLVAFLISNFKPRFEAGGKFSVLARSSAFDQTKFSFDIGKEILAQFNKYLGVNYELLGNEKMALAAIPDFKSGAMENWGLMTFREISLLYHPTKTTLKSQQRIANTISHEQAHSWFGNYITCDWWSHLWLNEGFARYFEYFMVDQMRPFWNIPKLFVVEQIHPVFVMDSLNGTHPMSDKNVKLPEDYSRMFDAISYNKGAAIVRMIYHVLQPTNFKSALQSYIKNNVQTTAVPNTLLKELKSKWPGDVVIFEQFFKDFTEQAGYPLITVKISKDGKSLTVSQQRFLMNKQDGADATLTYTTPFTFTTDNELDFSNTKPTMFLKKSEKTMSIPLEKKVKFIIANIQQTGYYRVNYAEVIWRQIHKFLNSKSFDKIDEINRAQIINDLFNLGRANILSYHLIMDILEYIIHETSYTPWVATFHGYLDIAVRLGTDMLDVFSKHILRLTKQIYKKLGFIEKSGEQNIDTFNRENVLNWVCKYGSKDCISTAKEYFKRFSDKNIDVPINIRQPVYCAAIREGGPSEFDFLWRKYLRENVATEQVLILTALGCTKSKDIVEKYLKYILSQNIRFQDKLNALYSAYNQNPENVQVVFAFVLQEYKDFSIILGGISEVAVFFSRISSSFTRNEQISTLRTFAYAEKESLGGSFKILQRSLDKANNNLKWSSKILPQIMEIIKVKNSTNLLKSFNITTTAIFTLIAMKLSY